MTSRNGVGAEVISNPLSSNMQPSDSMQHSDTTSVDDDCEQPWLIDIKSTAG